MLEGVLFFGLIALMGFVAIDGVFNDDKDPEPDSPEPSEEPMPLSVLLESGETYEGSDGPEVFSAADPDANLSDVTVRARGGDDLIEVFGDGFRIDAGDGNDTIRGDANGNGLNGGAGDDSISVSGGDNIDIEGGAGDDTIAALFSYSVSGGEGADTIKTQGTTLDGTGQDQVADGGAGDDIFQHKVFVFPPPTGQDESGFDEPTFLSGGAGADQFQISFGANPFSIGSISDQVFIDDLDALVIRDFEPGVDGLTIDNENPIIIDLGDTVASYEIGEVALVENSAEGQTDIRLFIASDELPFYSVTITLGATGLSIDDITFLGDISEVPTSFLVENLGLYNGSNFGDVFTFDPEAGRVETTIDAGVGDDTISLVAETTGIRISNSAIDGGAGDDQIRVNSFSSTIDGGSGDDEIENLDLPDNLFPSSNSTLLGGSGDDTISGDLSGGLIDGGDGDDRINLNAGIPFAVARGSGGNDVIDIRGSFDVDAFGGAGDDTIFLDGRSDSALNTRIRAFGDAGDDTLIHEARPDEVFFIDQSPAELTGGEGSDRFEIRLLDVDGVDDPNDPLAPDEFDVPVSRLQDFNPAEDTLAIDLRALGSSYNAISGQLTEDATAGRSTLTIRLEGAAVPTQNIQIEIGAIGLDPADIEIIGGALVGLS